MSTVESILNLLNKWPTWKRITEAPDKIEFLEKRVFELESKLQRHPGEACPSCGEWEFRVIKSEPSKSGLGDLGVKTLTKKCKACGFEDQDTVTPELNR